MLRPLSGPQLRMIYRQKKYSGPVWNGGIQNIGMEKKRRNKKTQELNEWVKQRIGKTQ